MILGLKYSDCCEQLQKKRESRQAIFNQFINALNNLCLVNGHLCFGTDLWSKKKKKKIACPKGNNSLQPIDGAAGNHI